jgi:exopolysaccharide biosynthesis polyprenyl glycosylphosphotransferase
MDAGGLYTSRTAPGLALQRPLPGLEPYQLKADVHANGRRRVLVVGAGGRGQEIAQELMARQNGHFEVVGFVDDRTDLPRVDGLPILGRFDQVLKIASRHQVDEIILAYMPNWQEQLLSQAALTGTGEQVRIKVLPGFYDASLGDLRIEPIADIPLVSLGRRPASFCCLVGKRCFDIVFSLIMLLLSAPVLVLATIAIKVTSRGPVFYRQNRVGMNGRIFQIHKLRTMVLGAETGTGPILAQQYDERITPVGRFLRQTRIDETPQCWNVLKGDMSVVGPRPERPEFAEEFAKSIPRYAERLKVRPGITGLAQVYGGYRTSVYHKLRYDWIYLHRMSLWQDLRIIFRTAGIVLSRAGR